MTIEQVITGSGSDEQVLLSWRQAVAPLWNNNPPQLLTADEALTIIQLANDERAGGGA